MSLGEKLKILRLRTGKTLRQQGRVMNVSMNSVYRWEHNLAVPRKSMLKRMAEHYGVPFDWLLSNTAAVALAGDTERNLLRMFKKLRDSNKHKVLKYIEDMYFEECSKV